jgi:hypothetical protein
VETFKKRLRKNGGDGDKTTAAPKEPVEEQTNAIPHLPNYWIPAKDSSNEGAEKRFKAEVQITERQNVDPNDRICCYC